MSSDFDINPQKYSVLTKGETISNWFIWCLKNSFFNIFAPLKEIFKVKVQQLLESQADMDS